MWCLLRIDIEKIHDPARGIDSLSEQRQLLTDELVQFEVAEVEIILALKQGGGS